MNRKNFILTIPLALMLLWVGSGCAPPAVRAGAVPIFTAPRIAPTADNPNPPAEPVKLIFIHHSCGGHWLADVGEHNMAGGLGQELMNNNYYVSATNYGWGPGSIGSNTNIPDWPDWFTGPSSSTILDALYDESGQNICGEGMCFGNWSRLGTDPGGENEIIMFKSCYPNSDVYGNPDDPPAPGPNGDFTVSNFKAVYNDLLTYFETRQDKLFIVITAPPMAEASYVANDAYTPAADRAANARAFNDWLVNDWLDGYAYNNVAVFDFYSVLTSNGSASRVDDTSTNEEPNDYALRPDGNHHYWNGSGIVHAQTIANDFSAYPYFSVDPETPDPWCDDHPTAAGNIKATAEFVQLLNVFYNRWAGGAVTPTPTTTGTPSTATPTATATATGTLPPSTATATATPTETPPIGQQTMTFQDGVSPNASYAGTTDVILANDAEPNANLGGAENLETFFGEAEYRRSLMRWDLSALPGDATINGAAVELYRYEGDAASSMQLALYRVTRDWAEGTGWDLWPGPSYVPDGATWTLASPGTAWTTPGGDFDATIVGQTTLPADMANGWVSMDATAAVRAWVEGGLPNYGLLLRPQSGEHTYHYYHSRNHSVPDRRPRLVVTYTVGVATATPTVTGAPPTSTPTSTPTPTRTGPPPTDHFVYLPLILKAWSAPAPTPTPTPTTIIPAGLIQPADLVYQGAFRLPGGDTPPQTFAYGGNAMTFNPDGDPSNRDAYPGSLFVMGHDRMAWGVLPDGSQVAEVSIPVPGGASDPADLPQAGFIQGFHDVTAGFFTQLEEIPRTGMQYLNHADTGPKIHLCWGQHLQFEDEASHAWFNPTLATPNLQGVWFIGHQNLYRTNGYMFDIPTAWADAHAQGRYLATGRMRDGGQGGMGPPLIAYRPWLPDGSAPPSGTHLEETTLLLYENAYNTSDFVRCLNGYQHPDEWEGGAWMTTPSGKSAVLFAGTKSTGAKHWYGFINPLGPEYPCVDEDSVPHFLTCRMADGSSCPAEDFAPCCDEEQGDCVTYRGWWSSRWDAQFILYDPADLAQVAAGEIESWEPQPYASLDIDEHLYLDPPAWDLQILGWGVQRRNRIGAAAYDRDSGHLYVLELYADGAKPVVHVWRVE